MGNIFKWNAANTGTLTGMYINHYPVAAIAARIGCTKPEVMRRVADLGLQRKEVAPQPQNAPQATTAPAPAIAPALAGLYTVPHRTGDHRRHYDPAYGTPPPPRTTNGTVRDALAAPAMNLTMRIMVADGKTRKNRT